MTTEAQEPQEAQESPPTESLKVVITLKDGWCSIGVSSPGRDPHIVTQEMADAEGLEQVLEEVPDIVERARQLWETVPQNPKYVRPAPPTPARAPRAPRAGRTPPTPPSPAGTRQSQGQTSLFT